MYRNYLLHSLLSLLFIFIISHTFSEGTVLRNPVSRAFAPELIKGHYSKSATYPGTSGDQCPKSFKFEGHAATARGSSVVHKRIVVDGVKCTSEGEVNFLKLDAAIEIPHVLPALREKDIARRAAVALLKNSESFLGVAKTDMHCGKNIVPKGAAYAFVFEKKDVPLASGQLVLKKNLKHVLIFYKRAETVIGCVYDNGSKTNVHGQNPSPVKPPTTGGPVAEEPSPDPTTTGSSTNPVTGSAKGNTEDKKPEPSPGPRECFSADSTVELITGEKRRMADVKIGDVVRVGAETFSEIFMTTHNDPETSTTFLKIRAGDKQIVLTPGHFLYVNGQLRPARFVRINDKLYNAENQPLKVHEISRVQRKGLYNPQTLHGDIIVDGIRTSTYTTAIMPSAAHALLAPLRAFQVGIRGVPITETVA